VQQKRRQYQQYQIYNFFHIRYKLCEGRNKKPNEIHKKQQSINNGLFIFLIDFFSKRLAVAKKVLPLEFELI
jgi:hypothetical protein